MRRGLLLAAPALALSAAVLLAGLYPAAPGTEAGAGEAGPATTTTAGPPRPRTIMEWLQAEYNGEPIVLYEGEIACEARTDDPPWAPRVYRAGVPATVTWNGAQPVARAGCGMESLDPTIANRIAPAAEPGEYLPPRWRTHGLYVEIRSSDARVWTAQL